MNNWLKKRIRSKDELYIRDIVIKFLEDSEVKKSIAPISQTVYLESDLRKIYIKIHYTNNRIDICSSTFLYKKDISSTLTNMLVKKAANQIEKEMEDIDKKLFTNEMDLLRKLIKDE